MFIEFKLKVRVADDHVVHVGTGEKLKEGFDFLILRNQLRVYDVEALFENYVKKLGHSATNFVDLWQEERPLEKILNSVGDSEKFLSFFLPIEGEIATGKREFVPNIAGWFKLKDGKTVRVAYIPGSSIKGAFRTALAAWSLGYFTAEEEKWIRQRLWGQLRALKDAGYRKREKLKTFCKQLENLLFGIGVGDKRNFPNRDVLRFFKISDMLAGKKPLEWHAVCVVLAQRKKGIEQLVEVMNSGLELYYKVWIERPLEKWFVKKDTFWKEFFDNPVSVLKNALKSFYGEEAIYVGWGKGFNYQTLLRTLLKHGIVNEGFIDELLTQIYGARYTKKGFVSGMFPKTNWATSDGRRFGKLEVYFE